MVQVHEVTLAHGAYPSPYNYYSFPKSVCTSINEVRRPPHSCWRVHALSMGGGMREGHGALAQLARQCSWAHLPLCSAGA